MTKFIYENLIADENGVFSKDGEKISSFVCKNKRELHAFSAGYYFGYIRGKKILREQLRTLLGIE